MTAIKKECSTQVDGPADSFEDLSVLVEPGSCKENPHDLTTNEFALEQREFIASLRESHFSLEQKGELVAALKRALA